MDKQKYSRSGIGYDVHAFDGDTTGVGVTLGGIEIPHDCGLKGHSDADVVLHAITDALFGTIGAGDIGQHFSPNDPKWKGCDSSHFVTEAKRLIEKSGGQIIHIDVTIVCEAPKIGPHRDAMKERIAGILGMDVSDVSVKATTTEKLGAIGRGEGIAAMAVASVYR